MYINFQTWPLKIESQGDHNIPAHLDEITKFFDEVISPKIVDHLNQDEDLRRTSIDVDVVCRSFFSRGDWRLNVERTALKGNSHYRNNSIRVYPHDEKIKAHKVVIQLQNGQRRKAFLHPPKAMTRQEFIENTTFLSCLFSQSNVAIVPQTIAIEVAERTSKVIEDLPLYSTKQKTPMEKTMHYTAHAFRSRVKKMDFIARFIETSGDENGGCVDHQSLLQLLEKFWLKNRPSPEITFNNLVSDSLMVSLCSLETLVIEASGRRFCLSELGEILLDEYREEMEKRKEEERQNKRKDLERTISREQDRLKNLEDDIERTTKRLNEAQSELTQLN